MVGGPTGGEVGLGETESRRGFVSAEDVDKRFALSDGHVATLAILETTR